jgi:hypothetical protein
MKVELGLVVFGTFMLTIIGLVVYNVLTVGIECVFCTM